jgi:iron complex transport system permease protein
MFKTLRRFSAIQEHNKSGTIFIISILALLVAAISSAFIGVVYISPIEVSRIFLSQIPLVGHYFSAGIDIAHQPEIIVYLREPHILGAVIIGAVLGVGGAVIQSIFKNPITEPYMIGISSGAALGAVLSIAVGLTILGVYTLQVLAFIFSALIVGLIYFFSLRSGRVPIVYMLLTGIAVSVFVSSIVAFMLYNSPNLASTSEVFFWLMGSVDTITWAELIPVALLSIASMFILSLYTKELDTIQLGEDYARSVGVKVESLKIIALTLVTVSVSAVVSISGLIGFVGLVVPHISRLLHGGSNRKVIPSSAILGALFLVLAYDVSRLVIAPKVVPIGIITGMIGVPFFIYLLRKLAGGYYAD